MSLQVIPNIVTQGGAGTSDWRIDLKRGQTILFAVISVAGLGANQIVAADATKKIKVLSYVLVVTLATSVKWQSAANDLSGAMPIAANGGISSVIGSPAGGWLFETNVNEALNLNLGVATAVCGHISYFLET